MNQIQYISDKKNNVTGVIIPIDLWEELQAEKETAYLKYDFSGCWSRRIDREHRPVYEVMEDKIRILVCRYHY
ncbi:MAG: Txe/YoeB family addiction module toxin [Desulfobacteraceae bacterium]|nr:MAG: Txe/YoeB family addiction module toxin [Desulfobacteraceae bacterium]